METKAYISIEFGPGGTIATVLAKIQAVAGVVSVDLIFGIWDAIVTVIVADQVALTQAVLNINRIKGVAKTSTNLVIILP